MGISTTSPAVTSSLPLDRPPLLLERDTSIVRFGHVNALNTPAPGKSLDEVGDVTYGQRKMVGGPCQELPFCVQHVEGTSDKDFARKV